VSRGKGAGGGGKQNRIRSGMRHDDDAMTIPTRETSVKADRYARAELFVDAVIVSRAPREKNIYRTKGKLYI